MTKKAIHVIAQQVLELNGGPMTAREIHDRILEEGLYEFNAQDPVNIVRSQLRRHSVNVKPSSGEKVFQIISGGAFDLIDSLRAR